jgi:tRNA dimethylallyltransferase
MLPETKLPILVGPTGVGKTAVAIELCELIGGEIVSADSMQVYRRLDIGTAKATREERARVRHHLIDVLDPDEEYSAARWAQEARCAIAEIRARGKQPVVVGGTGFYIAALLFPEHLASAPPDPQLRKELEEVAARDGSAVLHTQLQALDADAAARLHPNDVPRVVRAIEVARYEAQHGVSTPEPTQSDEPALPFVAFGLTLPRERLVTCLNARIEVMLEAGFMRELRELLEDGYGEAAPLQSLGYKQMRPALTDETQFEPGVELWKRETRRYAKRQMTWFRHQLPVQWIEMDKLTTAQAAERIAAQLAQGGVEDASPKCELAMKMS